MSLDYFFGHIKPQPDADDGAGMVFVPGLAELLEKHHVQEVARRQDQEAQKVIEIHRRTGVNVYSE